MLCTKQIALYNCQEGKQTKPHVIPVRQDVSLCAHLGHRILPSLDGVSCYTLSRKRWFIGFLNIADANFMRNVHNLKRSFSYYFFFCVCISEFILQPSQSHQGRYSRQKRSYVPCRGSSGCTGRNY